jgi:nitroreductase
MLQEKVKALETDPDMSLVDAIYQRRSVRGYLDKEVPRETLERIFEIAQQAPSNCNVQPWKVYVASGELKKRLSAEMVRRTAEGVAPNPDYPYRGVPRRFRKRIPQAAGGVCRGTVLRDGHRAGRQRGQNAGSAA